MSFVHNLRDQTEIEDNANFEVGNKLGEIKHIIDVQYDKYMIIYFCE